MEKPTSNRKRRRNKNRSAPDKRLNRQKARDKHYKKRFKKLMRQQQLLLDKGWTVLRGATFEQRRLLGKAGVIRKGPGVNNRNALWAPAWASDIVHHPQFSFQMVLRAHRETDYRKEVVMEARLLQKGKRHVS